MYVSASIHLQHPHGELPTLHVQGGTTDDEEQQRLSQLLPRDGRDANVLCVFLHYGRCTGAVLQYARHLSHCLASLSHPLLLQNFVPGSILPIWSF